MGGNHENHVVTRLQCEERPIAQGEQLVSAEELLMIVWSRASRPSLRWLREQQAAGAIPFVKVAGRVWFSPSEVRRHLARRWTYKSHARR